MADYRLDFSYDGTIFHGYARQPGLRTVQGELEKALVQVLRLDEEAAGKAIKTQVAGRTDAGVHARQQVVSFHLDRVLDGDRLARRLSRLLEPEIVVYQAGLASDGFSARFDAVSRTYRYHIINQPFPSPLYRNAAWHVKKPVDVEAMNRVVAQLVGEYDFASFCRRAEGRSTVREVLSAVWTPGPDILLPDNLLILEITASSFCHQMVRSIVAFAVEAGLGRRSAQETHTVLEAHDRAQSAGVAPPHGLVLWRVNY